MEKRQDDCTVRVFISDSKKVSKGHNPPLVSSSEFWIPAFSISSALILHTLLSAAALTLRCLLKAGLLCQVRLYVFRLLGRSMDTDA